jgi:hypothetical protein
MHCKAISQGKGGMQSKVGIQAVQALMQGNGGRQNKRMH